MLLAVNIPVNNIMSTEPVRLRLSLGKPNIILKSDFRELLQGYLVPEKLFVGKGVNQYVISAVL